MLETHGFNQIDLGTEDAEGRAGSTRACWASRSCALRSFAAADAIPRARFRLEGRHKVEVASESA